MEKKKDLIFLNIGGFTIQVVFHENDNRFLKKLLFEQIKDFYRGFILSTKAKSVDYQINIYSQSLIILDKSEKNLKREFSLLSRENIKAKKINTYYYVSLSEFSFLLTQIIQKLLERTGFMLHASAAIYRNQAYLFTGPSGIGKSTIAKLLKRRFTLFADDTVIIKKDQKSYICYQTPIIEKETYKKTLVGYPIRGIFFLKQAKNQRLYKVEKKEKLFGFLSRQIFINNHEYNQQINLLLAFTKNFNNFYSLSFRKNKKELEKIVNEIH